jgi:probable HAF family extracellular repeat protein
MNQSGQLTGFFLDLSHGILGHAMAYSNGVRADLGTLGGTNSEGHSINVSGQVVGVADLTGGTQSHAFVTSAAGLQDLGTLGGNSSTATAINDNGVIIGDSDLQGGGTGAFILTNGVGVLTSIGNLGSNYSSAAALNNNNLVVGQAGVASGGTNAFSYFNGVLSNLGTLGADYSAAFAVNDAGEIVGESAINSADTHGFVYINGTMTDVGTLGGTFSTAYLVNPAGQAVGVASLAGEAEIHGFLYANGTMTDLGTLGGAFSLPNAINTNGQIVGDTVDELGNSLAFIWENGTLTDLNALLPANSGWVLMQAVFINDAGRIAGVGNITVCRSGSSWILSAPTTTTHRSLWPVRIQTVSCSDQAKLDGSGSHDADSDPLTYEWSANGSVLGTTVTLSVSLPMGNTVVTLKVSDPCGASTLDSLTVTVVDTNAPTGTCPAPVTVSADATCQAAVPDFVPQVSATDNCTPVVITQDLAPGTLVGLGPHTITITVKDTSGNASSCQVLFTVMDTTPPTITGMPAPFTVPVGSDCQAQMPNMLEASPQRIRARLPTCSLSHKIQLSAPFSAWACIL